ncbi:MAG: TVP38/TMEM64 family protein [Bacilli bacterium]|nr:TVP38/TMEM64 family protein [Bacilli bacterium]
MDLVTYLIEYSTDLIASGGIIIGFLLVFLECFIPALPLSAFVVLNVNAFGFFFGVLISWLATCFGSFLCYLIFSYVEEKFIRKWISKKTNKKIALAINKFKNIKLTKLVFLITLPFTPSFLINIICGIADVSKEKFLISLLIGKVFTIIFWGYIGKSILDSLTNIYSLIYIIIALIVSYIISKIISRKMNIE